MTRSIPETIEYLFNRYWDEELTEEEETALEQVADDLVSEFGWKDVYSEAMNYLHQECPTPESVINFAHLYWIYMWHEIPIPDPYAFLAYFYYRIDWQASKYDDMDILDSLAINMLPKAGFREADLGVNPRYMPENDPVLQKEVAKLKTQNRD